MFSSINMSVFFIEHHYTMKAALVLCFLAVACAQYVPGEFMLRVDEQFIKTQKGRDQLATHLKTTFDYELLSTSKVGKLQFLRLKGDDKFINTIAKIPGVKYIERNTVAQLFCTEAAHPGTWGLDRIDQTEALSYSNPTEPSATYTWGTTTGEGVSVYVLDTGIETTHDTFDTRARWGYTSPGLPDEDDNNHGTHCAGTVGGNTYGVAKGAELVAVKVINWWGGGVAEDFVLGMDWILSDHQARGNDLGEMAKSVISISLGFDPTQSIDDSVQELVDNGVIVVAAAGNNDFDASNISPARAPATITVGMFTYRHHTHTHTHTYICMHILCLTTV